MFHVRQVQKGADNMEYMDYLCLSALNCDGLWITNIFNILHVLCIIDSQWEIIAKLEELMII